ncbi:Ribosome recycling factor [Musa troglodytarum]|uniref:Ribosome-recycling factor, chloroplastic n=1 Tax=Musa troglodytarum TaxID=320322 RepID=A0A9E7IG78_9LILI|nr:Ribosome recycling factor [Musa troglodytarum]
MAVCLRRALQSRSLLLLRASRCVVALSPSSYLCPRDPALEEASVLGIRGGFFRVGSDCSLGSWRGFAKGKKSNENNDEKIQVDPNFGPTVKSTTLSQMEAAIVALSRELSKLRTGRASAGMLDHILVETGGAKMPLNHVAVVSVINSKTLSVTPYDPTALKAVESAVISSPLGLNPTPDGQRLIAAIPPLTKENMQALCKVVAKSSEDVKQSIRRARQKDSIKKVAAGFPKDDIKRLEKEIEEMTKRFVMTADDMCKAKEKEITNG